jgi:hypothetical protein
LNRVVADNAVPIGLVERSANLVEVTAGRVLGQFGTGFGGSFMLKVVPEPFQESLIDLFKGQFRQAMVAVQVMTGGDPDRMVGFAPGSLLVGQLVEVIEEAGRKLGPIIQSMS